jgi:hypothetical protein
MASLRAAAACLGLSRDFHVRRHFFGHRINTVEQDLSVATQLRLLRGPHFHVNLIFVGSERFEAGHRREAEEALLFLRRVYADANVGIGRVERHEIPVAAAKGFDDLESKDEAKALTHEFSFANDGVDVFMVVRLRLDDPDQIGEGVAPVGGPCDKSKGPMSGVVFEVNPFLLGVPDHTGRVLAHELGHYLGLEHVEGSDQADNVMFHGGPPGEGFTPEQVNTIKTHCFMRAGCAI